MYKIFLRIRIDLLTLRQFISKLWWFFYRKKAPKDLPTHDRQLNNIQNNNNNKRKYQGYSSHHNSSFQTWIDDKMMMIKFTYNIPNSIFNILWKF